MTTSVSSFGGNYGNNSSNETNTFTILRNSFGQSGTINIVIDEPEIKKDGNVDTPENENKAYDNLENKVVVNTTWSDVVDIKLRSLNNNFNFNNNGSATVSLKESGSMENNSSQVDIQIHDYPTDEPFLLEINLPEHSNFSFISKIPNLSTDINVPNKLEGDVKLEIRKGHIEVNKIRGENIHLETKDGDVSVSSVVEGRQYITGTNVKARRLMGKHVYVETAFDPYYYKNNTATTVPQNPTRGNIDVDALYGGEYQLMASYFGNVNVGTIQGALNIISYNNVTVAGVDGNIEVSTSGVVNVHFDKVEEDGVSSIFCHPDNDFSTINVSVGEKEETDIIIATNSTYEVPRDHIIVNEETKAADDTDLDNMVEGFVNYFEGTLLPTADSNNQTGYQFESGKIRTVKESGWDINDKEKKSEKKEKCRGRIFMIGGEHSKFTIESWMDKIKKKYDAMEESD
eukprot:g1105.t1